MKKGATFDPEYSDLISNLEGLKGKRITVIEHKTKNKHVEQKGILKDVTNSLFTYEVKLGRAYVSEYSFTFVDLKVGKVEILELNKEGNEM